MGLFLSKDMSSAYVGGTSVKEIYLGGTKIWPLGLPSGTTFKFDYTGSVQSVDLPAGRYKLQCWGAQGGNVTGSYVINGSKGGYSEGILNLTEPKTLYVFVGGQGTSYTSSASQTSTSVINGGWNGGGAGVRTSLYNSGDTNGRSFPRGGGGATDIALVTSSMSYSSGRTTRSDASLKSRIIVAGGGAGASARYTIISETKTVTNTIKCSATTVDINAVNWYGSYQFRLVKGRTYSVAKNLSSSTIGVDIALYRNGAWTKVIDSAYTCNGDAEDFVVIMYANALNVSVSCNITESYTTSSTTTSSGKSSGAQQGGGVSGKGQYPASQSSAGNGGAFGLGANQSVTNYRYCGGGGGGGWYGGGTNNSDTSTSYINYSGGGSGFVNTAANASYRPSGYTGLQLESGTTTAGDTSHPSISGSTETGHSGNGYAIITVL